MTISLEADEEIHIENGYMYSIDEIDTLAKAARLKLECQRFYSGHRFSVNLSVADHV